MESSLYCLAASALVRLSLMIIVLQCAYCSVSAVFLYCSFVIACFVFYANTNLLKQQLSFKLIGVVNGGTQTKINTGFV